jgi:1-phosphatidylinositol-4-phosphate 5-kinase
MGSPGKSGSFFYYSQDYRFIIKTIHHSEHIFLRKILKHYYTHIRNHPNTLLSRFIGLHRVKLPRGRKIHFIVMGNIFPPAKDIHEIYDLKGSSLGRQVTVQEIKENPRIVRKDLNWIQSGHHLYLGPDKRAVFMEQLVIDENFLEKLTIMDYSLLVGIHYIHRGNREHIRDKTLTIFETRSVASLENNSKFVTSLIKRPVSDTDPISLAIRNTSDDNLPSERRHFRFYREQGGFASTFEDNTPGNEIYFLGIIDILTPYSYVKKLEHAVKSLNYDRSAISAINPKDYGCRFLAFVKKHVLLIDSLGNVLMKLYPRELPPSSHLESAGPSSSGIPANPDPRPRPNPVHKDR